MGGLLAIADGSWPLWATISIAVLAVLLIAGVLVRLFGATVRSLSLRNESERVKSEVALARANQDMKGVLRKLGGRGVGGGVGTRRGRGR